MALVATMRNEGPYLLEWITYHRLIGFTDIVVCTNDCVDGSPALLDLLAARGLVRHLPCVSQADGKAQLHAYQQAQRMLEGDWPDAVMVLDADEFLNIHIGSGTVDELLATVPDATAFLVNWRVFGSSGHDRWSRDSVLRRFTRAAEREHGVNWSFKTLFRLPEAYHCPLLAMARAMRGGSGCTNSDRSMAAGGRCRSATRVRKGSSRASPVRSPGHWRR